MASEGRPEASVAGRQPMSTDARPSWDLALTSLLVVIAIALAPLSALLTALSQFSTDACAETQIVCDYSLLRTSFMGGFYLPSVVLLATVVILVIRFVQRRRGWWIALISIGLMVAISIGSILLTDYAIRNPGQTLF